MLGFHKTVTVVVTFSINHFKLLTGYHHHLAPVLPAGISDHGTSGKAACTAEQEAVPGGGCGGGRESQKHPGGAESLKEGYG